MIKVKRFHSTSDFTIGQLFLNDVQIGYTCEDEKREDKVMHETRIPAGRYEIKLRTFGGHHERYKVKFPWHRGMLWLQDVPKFKDILIHIGNDEGDTSGCLLVGKTANLLKGTIAQSTVCYTELYKAVIKEIEKGKKIFITIEDENN